MKKGITLGLAAMLATSCITPVAFAEKVTPKAENVIAKSYSKSGVRFIEKIHVNELTLEDAIRYAQQRNYQSIELDLELDKIDLNKTIVENQKDDLNDLISELRSKRNQLQNELDALEELQKNPPTNEGNEGNEGNEDGDSNEQPIDVEETIGVINEQIKQLESQITSQEKAILQLEDSLNSIDISSKNLSMNKDKLRESIEFSVSSIFIGLIQLEEQIKLMEATYETQKNEINAIRTKYELGLVSRKDFEKATRERNKIQNQVDQLKEQLKTEKQNFASTIGITYTGDYTLVKPEMDDPKLISIGDIDDLINDSYDMKTLKNNLSLAEKTLEARKSNNASNEEIEIAEIEVEIAELKIESLAIQFEKSINSTYSQLKQQFEKVKELETEYEYAMEDKDDLRIYYELGLMSRHDYYQANMNNLQAEFNYENAKYQYFLLAKQVLLMKKGFIISN